MKIHIGNILQFKRDFPLVQLQSPHYKMDNIIGAEDFKKGDTIRVLSVIGKDIFLIHNNNIFFVKSDEETEDLDYIFINITQQRRDKLRKLFGE